MSKIKILYVEDEPFLGKIVKESLESRAFEVRLVADGREVLAAFEAFRPAACVLDVMLPHVDGFALGREIRLRAPETPIIFLTAKNQTEDVLRGFESGGNDYVRKPFSMEELIARIFNLLKMSQLDKPIDATAPAGSSTVAIGQFVFSPKHQSLKLGEMARQLSYRESQLLDILVSRRNLPVPRKEILERIWGNDSFFNSRNLDVYIAKLREYLREDANVSILTLKGVGYRMVW